MKEMTIVPKLYDAILWYAAKLSRYPKAYRYNLGERGPHGPIAGALRLATFLRHRLQTRS